MQLTAVSGVRLWPCPGWRLEPAEMLTVRRNQRACAGQRWRSSALIRTLARSLHGLVAGLAALLPLARRRVSLLRESPCLCALVPRKCLPLQPRPGSPWPMPSLRCLRRQGRKIASISRTPVPGGHSATPAVFSRMVPSRTEPSLTVRKPMLSNLIHRIRGTRWIPRA